MTLPVDTCYSLRPDKIFDNRKLFEECEIFSGCLLKREERFEVNDILAGIKTHAQDHRAMAVECGFTESGLERESSET